MICQNAIGYHNEIQELLKKSMLNMNDAQIRAWMEHEFKPETMFCYWQDGRLTSCLQTKRRILSFKHQKIAVATISLAATLPDYRQRDQFGQLLEAFLEQSSHNELLTIFLNFLKTEVFLVYQKQNTIGSLPINAIREMIKTFVFTIQISISIHCILNSCPTLMEVSFFQKKTLKTKYTMQLTARKK